MGYRLWAARGAEIFSIHYEPFAKPGRALSKDGTGNRGKKAMAIGKRFEVRGGRKEGFFARFRPRYP